MSSTRFARARIRAAAVVPALALAAAGVAAAGTSGGAAAAPSNAAATTPSAGDDYYINYVAPRAEKSSDFDPKIDRKTGAISKEKSPDALSQAFAVDRKNARGNPTTARELARLEAKSLKTGQSPQQIKSQYKGAKATQTARLLTILVEFNDQATTTSAGSRCRAPPSVTAPVCPAPSRTARSTTTSRTRLTATVKDNNSMWLPDFSSEHYNKMLYTKDGITERVRKDLTGPDGQPGFDISGFTMKNMYEEMSKGAYTVAGAATPWITVPHSEAWYGASRCTNGVAPAPQAMNGHPDNPLGPGQLPIDAVAALAKAQPNFPWADYDIEDQGDRDGDGNVNEPDGVIDHVVLVHAGEDKSGGGGAEGVYSIWAHSSAVAGGAPVPGTNLRLSNYIVQPEDSGVGVFAHEYGHDLGLPDLYDTSGAADSDVDFWDLMSSGSHSGPIFQSMPAHMGIWDKWVLGWANPVEISPGQSERDVIVGQTSRTPKGTQDGIKVNLPNKVITLAEPHSGSNMWYSGADQDWADVKLSRTVDVPNATDAKFWMWNNFVIEADWDFGFVEVSTDGGTTWTEQKVYDEAGDLVSTDDGYGDPNGRMKDFGDKKYGLTGDSHGWRHDYVDLSGYAGKTVQVRLRYATDAAFAERGWFGDDFSVTGGGATTWSDDVEGADDNGWTLTPGTFTDTTGAGWHKDSGTQVKAQYYLVEWRNYDGFDKGLQYAYDTTYQTDSGAVEGREAQVQRARHARLVPRHDVRQLQPGHDQHDGPAELRLQGRPADRGRHFDPLRRTGADAALDPTTVKNLPLSSAVVQRNVRPGPDQGVQGVPVPG